MEHLVRDLYHTYHQKLQKTNLFTNLSKHVTADVTQEIVQYAESLMGYSYPAISATMFMNFKRTGNRTDYENIYFTRRRVLNAFVLAEILEQQGRFLDDIVNGIFCLCEESAWQLPAHNSYIRDTPQLLLPDTEAPVLDLFACETAELLATIYHLLKDSLDKVSPFITKRILAELQKRIITPYLSTHFWWMGNGDEPMCNWTIWCTQNILLTAAMIPLEDSIYESIVQKSCESTDYFLKEYGVDGCCDEGAQYYRHAGLCLFLTLHLLNQICENTFAPLWQHEKIRNIAEYICNVHVDDIYYINFADCSPIAGRAGVREFLFGKAVGSDALCSFAALDFAANEDPYQTKHPDELNLCYKLLTLQYASDMIQFANMHKTQIPARNIWYESVGVFIARTGQTTLAVKGGNNDDSHNHNDTGSIILYHNGKPILIDVGVESYTQKTFSPNRYEIWTMQSQYHNLPILGGFDQMNGASYRATNVRTHLALPTDITSLSTIEMDIAAAYPTSSHISSYKRNVNLETIGQKDIVTLTDTCSFEPDADNTSVILNFMTYEKPVFADNILTIGSLYSFQVQNVSDCKIHEIPITDARLQTAWKHEVYRIQFHLNENTFFMQTL